VEAESIEIQSWQAKLSVSDSGWSLSTYIVAPQCSATVFLYVFDLKNFFEAKNNLLFQREVLGGEDTITTVSSHENKS
jgi:hypothetical protein